MLKKLIAGAAMVSLLGAGAEACTVMVVTKGASADGNMIVSHSNDGRGAEMNLSFVPAKDHPKGSKRPVYATAVALDEMPDYNAFCSRILSRRSGVRTTIFPAGRTRSPSATSPRWSTLTLIWTRITASSTSTV